MPYSESIGRSSFVVRRSSARRGVRGGKPANPPRTAEGEQGLPRPIQWVDHRPPTTDHRRGAQQVCDNRKFGDSPTNSGSPAGVDDTPQLAKEPLPPRIVVQCAVASTPADTGSGLAGRRVLVAPSGSCCFQLDEIERILLRLRGCVKRSMMPLAIVAGYRACE